MHWAERIADELIAENPGKEEFLCAAGTSPSGSVHIGNFRDVATPFFCGKSAPRQREKGKTYAFVGRFRSPSQSA